MAVLGIHKGYWGGLPDFGVTEAIARGIGTIKGTAPAIDPYTGGSQLGLSGSQYQSLISSPMQQASTRISTSAPIQSAGTVLGTSTSSGDNFQQNTANPVSGGGDGGGEAYDPYAALRNEISSGWDSYLASLDSQLNSLSSQRGAQENIAQSQLKSFQGDLGLQRTQGLQQLGTERTRTEQNQAKTLRDLAANISNAFKAGNVYLGARGAGDSSAANQYSYALSKIGTRERSNVMQNTADILADIGMRETNLNNIYNNEMNKIQEDYNQQINSIASWFADAQRQIQAQKSQGQLGKSQDLANLSKDILNQALGALRNIQGTAQNQMNVLDKWAVANAQNLGNLRSQFQTISNPDITLPQANTISGAPQVTASGGIYTPIGYGYETDTEKNRNSIFPAYA